MDKRKELIKKLHSIIEDLENGYDGFMYLYDIIVIKRSTGHNRKSNGAMSIDE